MTLPTPFYAREGIRIYVGDNREVLPHIEPVHAVVTDPPYGLSFMGKGWDHQVPGIEFWQAIGEAMLPGAHLLAFGGTRTYHRMAVAIEDAGYEIRDTLQWLYGSGFPKSHDVSKAIDKMAGAERALVERIRPDGKGAGQVCTGFVGGSASPRLKRDDLAATPAAEQWQGWGTALKPAYEPIIMARLPFKGTVAQNVLAHGTGAINVDASRIGTDNTQRTNGKTAIWSDGGMNSEQGGSAAGRWPANVILDEAAAAALDAMSGVSKGRIGMTQHGSGTNSVYGTYARSDKSFTNDGVPDTGGASRYFKVVEQDELPINHPGASRMAYHAKASRRDRSANGTVANIHPTCKPTTLMKYLIQMVTPPEGIVLDPFMGSGSTLVAAAELGFNAIGIELDPEYAEIAARRVDHAIDNRDPQLTLEGIA